MIDLDELRKSILISARLDDVDIDQDEFLELIKALEQAKEIIEKEEKDPYCCCETNRIWLTKFFPTQTKEEGFDEA